MFVDEKSLLCIQTSHTDAQIHTINTHYKLQSDTWLVEKKQSDDITTQELSVIVIQ